MEGDQNNYSGNEIAPSIEYKSTGVQNQYKTIFLIGFGFLLGSLISAGAYFFIYQPFRSTTDIQPIANKHNTDQFISTASTSSTTSIATTHHDEDEYLEAKSAEVIEQEAKEISAKFTNNNEEGIIGFYEAYVEGVKFVEASSTPAVTAIKNCLLNIYQNPSYSFTCYVNGIQGLEFTPKVTEKSPFLFLTGPAIQHRLIWITSELLPTATDITYRSEGEKTNSTLFVPEERQEDALEFIQEASFTTIHKGRHFLGGYSQQEPRAHMFIYIDLDDPFSKQYYPTILELRKLYSLEDLAIEVQHLPLTELHPNATYLANAAHCAADQNKEYYWSFIEGIFDSRDGNSAFDMSNLPQVASSIGLNASEFTTCTENGHYESIVANQAQTIITTGARGTPHTIIFNRITRVSEPEIIEGVRPLSELISVVDKILES